MEEAKAARQTKKRSLTMKINSISRHMAEDGDSDDLVTKRDELKGVFRVFELAHEVYTAQVTKESDIEECYKYFQEAQSSYINILKEIKAYIEQASQGSPATGSEQ